MALYATVLWVARPSRTADRLGRPAFGPRWTLIWGGALTWPASPSLPCGCAASRSLTPPGVDQESDPNVSLLVTWVPRSLRVSCSTSRTLPDRAEPAATPDIPYPTATARSRLVRHPGHPALFRSADPAWGDENLRELAAEVHTACSWPRPRRHRDPVQDQLSPVSVRQLDLVHNGYIADFARLRRDLLFAVDPDLFGNIAGSTDSELMFHLALTFGLRDDPIGGLERMAGFVEAAGAAADVANPLQMTVGVSDGQQIYAARYASGGAVNTLYVSEDVASIRLLYPERERFAHFRRCAGRALRAPGDLPGVCGRSRRDGPDCRRRLQNAVPSRGAS